MNKQQIIQKLSYIATNIEDSDMIRSNLFRFISDLAVEGVTDEKTYNVRSFPVEVRQEIILRDHFTCAYCNRVGAIDADPDGESWTVDHVVPFSRGGTTCADNGVLSCHRCNSEKRDMTPAEYIRWLRFQRVATPVDDLDERSIGIFPVQGIRVAQPEFVSITPDLTVAYESGGWDGLFELFFANNKDATQSQMRRLMSMIDGRTPDTFKSEAFRYYHRFSPNGDRNKYSA